MSLASVVLVSSNPTNLVLSGGFGISFIKYTAHVIVPFIAAAILVYPVFALMLYRSEGLIPRQIQADLADEVQSGPALVDPRGAVFGSVLLLVTLAVLVGTSTVGVPVWEVTVPPALLMLCRDGLHDWRNNRSVATERMTDSPPEQPSSPSDPDIYPMETLRSPNSHETRLSQTENSSTVTIAVNAALTNKVTLSDKLICWESRLTVLFPTVTTILCRLPVLLVPFAFLMFILVQALSTRGWVEVFSSWWAAWVNKTGTLGAIGGMGFVSCIMCNVSF